MSLLRYRLPDLIPIGRAVLLEIMNEGMLLLGLKRVLSSDALWIIRFGAEFIWLGVIVGKTKHTLAEKVGLVPLLHCCQMVFIDWALDPFNPQAAQRKRQSQG